MTKPSLSIDWAAALQRHRPWLQKVLRCRIGDQHAVDDVYQDVALAVVRQSQNGSDLAAVPTDPEKVAPWLYRITIRQAVNFQRKSNRKTAPQPTSEIEPFSEAPQPLDWMLAKEQQQNVKAALQQLRPAEREILTLKYSQNWTYQQLANHLGVPVKSIEYRLLKARQRLRNLLTEVSATTERSGSLKPPITKN